MITTDKYYASFDKAGFLKTALWTPSVGLPGAGVQQTARVRYREPNRDVLAGSASVSDHTMRFPASVFPGLQRGELVNIDGKDFLVREDPSTLKDGSELEAPLSRKP